MAEITKRMKWIVKQLKDHPDAVIKESRDWFMEKSHYALEWGGQNGESFHSHEVTNDLRERMTAAKLIAVVESRPVYNRGEFRTTERDYGLPT